MRTIALVAIYIAACSATPSTIVLVPRGDQMVIIEKISFAANAWNDGLRNRCRTEVLTLGLPSDFGTIVDVMYDGDVGTRCTTELGFVGCKVGDGVVLGDSNGATAFVHEFGHVLGVGHSADPSDVMSTSPFSTATTGPSADDFAAATCP
jgi:hypothetical protein